MSWSEIAAVADSQDLIGITVAGAVTTDDGAVEFDADLNKIYLEFEDGLIEFRRMDELEDGFKLKVSLVTTVVHEMVQKGDKLSDATSSVTRLVLPDAWDYKVTVLQIFLASASSFEEGIVDYAVVEIAHGPKIFPELFSSTRLLIHLYCVFGVQVQAANQFSGWIAEASHDREGRYIYKSEPHV